MFHLVLQNTLEILFCNKILTIVVGFSVLPNYLGRCGSIHCNFDVSIHSSKTTQTHVHVHAHTCTYVHTRAHTHSIYYYRHVDVCIYIGWQMMNVGSLCNMCSPIALRSGIKRRSDWNNICTRTTAVTLGHLKMKPL